MRVWRFGLGPGIDQLPYLDELSCTRIVMRLTQCRTGQSKEKIALKNCQICKFVLRGTRKPCSPLPCTDSKTPKALLEGKGKTVFTWSRAAARQAVSRAKRGSRRPSTDGNGSAGCRRKEAGVVYPTGTPRPARSGRGGASSRSLRAHRHS
jgi:hypothetical protein